MLLNPILGAVRDREITGGAKNEQKRGGGGRREWGGAEGEGREERELAPRAPPGARRASQRISLARARLKPGKASLDFACRLGQLGPLDTQLRGSCCCLLRQRLWWRLLGAQGAELPSLDKIVAILLRQSSPPVLPATCPSSHLRVWLAVLCTSLHSKYLWGNVKQQTQSACAGKHATPCNAPRRHATQNFFFPGPSLLPPRPLPACCYSAVGSIGGSGGVSLTPACTWCCCSAVGSSGGPPRGSHMPLACCCCY